MSVGLDYGAPVVQSNPSLDAAVRVVCRCNICNPLTLGKGDYPLSGVGGWGVGVGLIQSVEDLKIKT